MSKTFVYDRFDVRALSTGDLHIARTSDGEWMKAEDAINREAVLQAQIRTIETQLKDTKRAASNAAPAQPALAVWYGPMPESNGKTNWTAILHKGDIESGMTIARSEYPDRVRYEADHVRWLIGELAVEPWILDYDADKHSGYIPPSELVADPKHDLHARMKIAREAGLQLRIDGKFGSDHYHSVTGSWPAVCRFAWALYNTTAPQPAQTAQPDRCYAPSCGKWDGNDSCTCQRLGDWKGFHHPLCDQAPAPSAVVLDDERAAFEAWWEINRDQLIHDTDPRRHAEAGWKGRAIAQPVKQTRALDDNSRGILSDALAMYARKHNMAASQRQAIEFALDRLISAKPAQTD
jgi:hypothetical protein